MMRLRNYFIAGLLVLAPVAITVWILRFLFSFLDGISQPLLRLYIGRELPGVGIGLTVLLILGVGYLSSQLVGQAAVRWFDQVVSRIPLVSSVYRTVRQVVRGFSNTEGMNFKRTVLVRDEKRSRMALGFLTGEFSVWREGVEQKMSSVYVPTNHLYLGNIAIVPSAEVLQVDMTLEQGISAVLSCGGAIPAAVTVGSEEARKPR